MVTVHPFSERWGSLRDVSKMAYPNRDYNTKYGKTKGKSLGRNLVAKFGRQILEALKYFQTNGISYPYLHCGNVILMDGVCMLTDFENLFVGTKPRYDGFSEQQTMLRDFANVLFEMTYGFEPTVQDINSHTSSCSSQVAEIIRSIYSGSLSLDDLLENSFFNVTQQEISIHSDNHVNLGSIPRYKNLLGALNNC